MSIIDHLLAWQAGVGPSLQSEGVFSRVNVAVGSESAYIDLNGAETIGRVTVWSRGMCDVEVLSVESGDQVFWRHFDDVTPEELEGALELALTHIRSGNSVT